LNEIQALILPSISSLCRAQIQFSFITKENHVFTLSWRISINWLDINITRMLKMLRCKCSLVGKC